MITGNISLAFCARGRVLYEWVRDILSAIVEVAASRNCYESITEMVCYSWLYIRS